MQFKRKDNLEGSFRKSRQPSQGLDINLKLMEQFRTSTRSVPEEHGHRRAPQRKQESLIIINSTGFHLQRQRKETIESSKVCIPFFGTLCTYRKTHFSTFKSKWHAEEEDEKISSFSAQPASSLKSRQNNLSWWQPDTKFTRPESEPAGMVGTWRPLRG